MKKIAPSNRAPDRDPQFDIQLAEHLKLLYAVAVKMAHDQNQAEDLVQDTLVKALRYYHQFRPDSNLKAWLLTILRNTFINGYRQKVRRPQLVELDGTEPAPDSKLNLEATIFPQRNYDKLVELLDDPVRKAIDGLQGDFRKVVILIDIEGYSCKEAAEIVGRPVGTVLSRLFRGRNLLREQLKDYGASKNMRYTGHRPKGRHRSAA